MKSASSIDAWRRSIFRQLHPDVLLDKKPWAFSTRTWAKQNVLCVLYNNNKNTVHINSIFK